MKIEANKKKYTLRYFLSTMFNIYDRVTTQSYTNHGKICVFLNCF